MRNKVWGAVILGLALLVVVGHLFAGIVDEGHPVLHPVGHFTLCILFWWVCVLVMAPIVCWKRRRLSWSAGIAIAVVFVDYLLLAH